MQKAKLHWKKIISFALLFADLVCSLILVELQIFQVEDPFLIFCHKLVDYLSSKYNFL